MILQVLYLLCSLCLFIYSYGFLDYNLTLSSHPLFLRLVGSLQHLIYFDRPSSIKVYLIIMTLMCVLYIAILAYYKNKKIIKLPWKVILIIIAVLTFAYPMLSYDVYNYMFHGKILWFYHMNPHLHAPLEFTGDLWLRFMRWVHTPSAYGPVFTAIESPAYLFGLGKFVPVLYLMKISMSGFFVWCIYLVGKLGEELNFAKSKIVQSQLFLALNPFLLLDVVVNGHNDAVMIAFLLLSILYSLKSKLLPSIVALIASVGTKYVTALTLPLYFIKNPKMKILFTSLVLLLPVLILPGRFQPWYLVWAIIPTVLVDHVLARIWIVLASLAGLVYYVPYIATGFWLNSLNFVSVIIYLPIIVSLVLSRATKLRL